MLRDIIKDKLRTNPEGFTVDLEGRDYEGTGYAVAKSPITLDELDQAPQKGDYTHIGGWMVGDKFYLDRVVIIQNREQAIQTAQAFNQLAIWDFEKGETIYV